MSEPLLARLAAADRENAELRAQLRDASDFNRGNCERANRAEMHADGLRRIRDKALAENAELRGEVERLEARIVRADEARRRIERDRDEARSERDDAGLLWGRHYNDAMGALETQLAAAQAQLARLLRIFDGINNAIHDETLTEFSRLVAVSALRNAALSAAPQPKPIDADVHASAVSLLGDLVRSHGSHHPLTEHVRAFADRRPEPPVSDEPAGRSD